MKIHQGLTEIQAFKGSGLGLELGLALASVSQSFLIQFQ